jgi:hypothetical protein
MAAIFFDCLAIQIDYHGEVFCKFFWKLQTDMPNSFRYPAYQMRSRFFLECLSLIVSTVGMFRAPCSRSFVEAWRRPRFFPVFLFPKGITGNLDQLITLKVID